MKLIIGLGNPGFRYKKTRHNAGFMLVNYIQKNIHGFSKWKNEKKFKSEISENKEQGILLVKPQTYMNKSGEAAAALAYYYKLSAANLFVAHDDFDLEIGDFKIEQSRGSAGHHGVQAIINTLSVNDFWRLRIGIRPKTAIPVIPKIKAENFVLKKFGREEKIIIERIITETAKALLLEITTETKIRPE